MAVWPRVVLCTYEAICYSYFTYYIVNLLLPLKMNKISIFQIKKFKNNLHLNELKFSLLILKL